MKNTDLQANDIAVLKALTGNALYQNIAEQYEANSELLAQPVPEIVFPCLASAHKPVAIEPGIFVNRLYCNDNDRIQPEFRNQLYTGLVDAAFDFFIRSGWYGAFRVVSFHDNGPLSLINVGLVHELVLNDFLKAFPRAIVSENTLHCGLTKFQMHMFLGDKLYEMPLYNNSSAVLRKIELMAKAA